MLRILGFCLLAIVILVASAAALLGYFVYSPDPELPRLTGALTKGVIDIGGLRRTYVTYRPAGLAQGAPLLLVMHGSGEGSAEIRKDTGYGFERLADEHGFAVVYPNAYTWDWNDCSRVGDYSVNGREVDDVGFLRALVDKLIAEIGLDRGSVFATGVSAGGSMAIRLAIEAPSKFRAVAAVAANVPVPENFKCQPTGAGISVMIMNGSKDPLVPFDGGEVNLLGWFYQGGAVRSSRDSVQYFADIDAITAPPATSLTPLNDGFGVEQILWRDESKREVELVAIQGGGHGLPQPYYRRPRLLGPSPMQPDGPAMIWAFFARQRQ